MFETLRQSRPLEHAVAMLCLFCYIQTGKERVNRVVRALEPELSRRQGRETKEGESSLRLISLTASTTQSVNIVKAPPSITRHVICNNKQIFARCPAVASLSSLFEGETTFFAVHRNSRPCLRGVCLGQS